MNCCKCFKKEKRKQEIASLKANLKWYLEEIEMDKEYLEYDKEKYKKTVIRNKKAYKKDQEKLNKLLKENKNV